MAKYILFLCVILSASKEHISFREFMATNCMFHKPEYNNAKVYKILSKDLALQNNDSEDLKSQNEINVPVDPYNILNIYDTRLVEHRNYYTSIYSYDSNSSFNESQKRRRGYYESLGEIQIISKKNRYEQKFWKSVRKNLEFDDYKYMVLRVIKKYYWNKPILENINIEFTLTIFYLRLHNNPEALLILTVLVLFGTHGFTMFTSSGDSKYRGRGILMISSKENYAKLGNEYVNKPYLLSVLTIHSIELSIKFWLNLIQDARKANSKFEINFKNVIKIYKPIKCDDTRIQKIYFRTYKSLYIHFLDQLYKNLYRLKDRNISCSVM